ncbi:hypothetical protein CERSUDRAFT_127541 [Gelatoporia subvermispora B]|uniref:DUF6534 domain-containing protein n=1 Tax=Ceriporiopsis subvermispora (strain B) TaxID=914234 RepID=M2QZ97_CERS8|nr:hypothetical protein CERSUDRAFT_127541 [Gelatoporia subvermispora B]
MITVTLCYNLSKYRSGTPRSDRLVNILMMYTVNTGLLTSCRLGTLINHSRQMCSPRRYGRLSPFASSANASYVNSVLAVLNARKKLRDPSYHSQPARHASKSDKRSPAQLDLTEVRLTDVVISDEDPNNRTTREFCAVGVGRILNQSIDKFKTTARASELGISPAMDRHTEHPLAG